MCDFHKPAAANGIHWIAGGMGDTRTVDIFTKTRRTEGDGRTAELYEDAMGLLHPLRAFLDAITQVEYIPRGSLQIYQVYYRAPDFGVGGGFSRRNLRGLNAKQVSGMK